MLAVLEISLRDATGARSSANVRRWKLSPRARVRADAQHARRANAHAASAIDWIFDDIDDGAFAFLNVCETLGVDAERLRARGCGSNSSEKSGRREHSWGTCVC